MERKCFFCKEIRTHHQQQTAQAPDFLSLTDRPKERSFTNYPHLTLGVHADRLKVAVTIPNGVVRAVRKRLIDLDVKELIELNG